MDRRPSERIGGAAFICIPRIARMLFNSLDFAVFLPIVFLAYWFGVGRSLRARNLLLLVASYVFYGWWDWRFLGLIVLSTLIDFGVGRALGGEGNPARRKALLWVSIAANLGMLGFFKYADFFQANFVEAFRLFGREVPMRSLDIVLPVGISFYTFQTMSYTIDVYRRQMEPSRDPLAFAAYVAFFPQLVAGPIERAARLLPQFHAARTFERAKAVDGLRQMLWGFFKKIMVADTCAVHADRIFEAGPDQHGSTLLLGAVFFAFRIYGDFSGYSDIAIGTARLFGFSLMRNFAFPYFARDIAEFWRRWHISLSTWFRDYLYIPLGGSRGGRWQSVRNTFAIFLVSGFWHGANWTFVAWGALHALYFLPMLLLGRNRRHLDTVAHGRLLPSPGDAARMALTFLLVTIAWVFFRSPDVATAVHHVAGIFSPTLFSPPQLPKAALVPAGLAAAMLAAEWLARERQHALEGMDTIRPRAARWVVYYALVMIIFLFGTSNEQFIYFQF
jgi:D-alanyl-lipoteichoic acid acyltransferase DltB (MBOAT superfamily)